jgi:hypothetical protein
VPTYPYFAVSSTMPAFIAALGRSRPGADLDAWLGSAVGLKPSVLRNERAVLRRLRWIDDSGVTEDGWALRGDNARGVARRVLQEQFADLLSVSERSPADEEDALDTYLRTHTELGATARQRVIRTYLQLRQLAENGSLTAPEAPARARSPRRRSMGRRRSTGVSAVDPGTNEPGAPASPQTREVVFPLADGSVRIVAPVILSQEDVRILHGLIDLLAAQAKRG